MIQNGETMATSSDHVITNLAQNGSSVKVATENIARALTDAAAETVG